MGLDVSTSKTGWCLLSVDGRLVRMGCVRHAQEDDLFARAHALCAEIKSILETHRSVEIVIEEPLLRFAKGMSSASTLLTLNRFNGMVTYACWSLLGIKPTHLNVIFARRSLGIKKEKGGNVKDAVMAWVAADVPEYQWPTKTLTRGKNRGQTVFEDVCYDVADAYVMAKAGHADCVKRGKLSL